jgi:hypothetical protein
MPWRRKCSRLLLRVLVVLAEDVLLDPNHPFLGHARNMCMRRALAVVEVVSRLRGRLRRAVSMVMAGAMTVMGIMVVRMGVHRAIGVTVFVLVRVGVFMFVPRTMTVLPRVIVRMAVYGAVGMAVGMRVLVQVVVSRTVPMGATMIVVVGVLATVGVPVHVLVRMLMLVSCTVFVLVHMVVGVAVHRAVGVAMLVFMGGHCAPFHPGLAFSATAYRAHLSPPEIRFHERQW